MHCKCKIVHYYAVVICVDLKDHKQLFLSYNVSLSPRAELFIIIKLVKILETNEIICVEAALF